MSSNSSIICAVLRECHERLIEELRIGKFVQDLDERGLLSSEDKKTILFENTGQCQRTTTKKLLRLLEESRQDEILDVLIEHLRREDKQHLWTLLVYSKAKQRKIRSSLSTQSDDH